MFSKKIFFIALYSFIFLNACQTKSLSSAEPQAKSSDSRPAKTHNELIKQEKKKQSEEDLPFRGLDTTKKIDTIAFGSNLDQNQDQPIWSSVLKNNPDAFLFLGDSLSLTDPQIKTYKSLTEQYRKLNRNSGYRNAREKIPFLSTWNNEINLADKETARTDFIKYWSSVRTSLNKTQTALYYSKILGSKKETVQIILLDTSWNRDEFKKNPDNNPPTDLTATTTTPQKMPEPFVADDDKTKTILSDEQWNWLENELRKPAAFRILVSPLQVIANDHFFNKWGNFPHERERLFNLIKNTKAKNLVILSGDRGFASIAKTEIKGLPLIYEITSSGLNKVTDVPEAALSDGSFLNKAFTQNHFGLIKLNWDKRKASLELRSATDEVLQSAELNF